MKKGTKRLLFNFIIFIVILIGLDIIMDNIENETIKLIFWVLTIVFVVVALIFIVKLSKRVDREDNEVIKKYEEYIKNIEYEEARQLINNRISESKYGISELRCKLMLLILELTIGNNEEARNILEQTKWGILKYDVYYHKIIFKLYDRDLEQAKVLYNKLIKINNKRKQRHQAQIDNLNKLFNYFENGVIEEVNSQFQIINDYQKW